MHSTKYADHAVLKLIILIVAFFAFIALLLWGGPKYRVYSAEMRGKAALAQAENERQVTVRQAIADKDAAEHKAAAEILRAEGVAEANRIVAEGLGGPEGYLRYLAVEAMREQAASNNSTTIYVATEANIPITEASRFNRPQRTEE